MNDSNLLEFRSKLMDIHSKAPRRKGGRAMSSVAAATANTRALGKMLAPDMKWEMQVDLLYRELAKHYPDIKTFTRRRVRAFFFGEARRADFEEVTALEELKLTEEARREHHKFVAATTQLAAALAKEGAALSRKQMEVLERIARGRVDIPSDFDARSGSSVRSMAGAGNCGEAP